MRTSLTSTISAALIAAVASPNTSAQPKATTFVPHVASYAMSISGAPAGQKIDASGQVELRFERRCQAWALGMKSRMTVKGPNGPVTVGVDMAMTQSLDGRTYENRMKLAAPGQSQGWRTVGRLEADGAGVGIILKGQDRKKTDLPKGTLFPLSHSFAIVAAAVAGKSRHTALVFDPEGSGQLNQVVTTIQPGTIPAGLPIPAELKRQKAHRYTVKYFARQDLSSQVRPTVQYLSQDNGIALVMQGDMAGLKVTMRLTKVVALKLPTCSAQ